MFCPECKAEYREGFTKCADCEVDLVDKLEEEPVLETDPDAKFVELLRTNDLTDVAQIKGILDSEGITYFIQGDQMMSIRPLDNATLLVADNDVKRATELLKGVKLNYFRFKYMDTGTEKKNKK